MEITKEKIMTRKEFVVWLAIAAIAASGHRQ